MRSLGRWADGGPPPPASYDSRFLRWDERASVRVKPQRRLDDGQPAGLYFPPELVAAYEHPLVAALGAGARRRLLVQSLYAYLHFTSELEDLAVIPVASMISRNRSGLPLPGAMRADAFKIVTDEAWHAQFSFDLLDQVARATEVVPRLPERAPFVDRLDAVHESLPADLRGAEEIAFAVVSETLVSAILADLPHDLRLPTAVRDVVRDHAEDEGRHHAYFRALLGYFWSALRPRERRELGRRLPAVIFAFLEPDYRALGLALADIGLAPTQAHQVIDEAYPAPTVAANVARASTTTIRYFTELGALDDPETEDAFAAAGLLDPVTLD